MKFILFYEGEILSAQSRNSKNNEHAIRKELHKQLKVLYSQEPYNIHPSTKHYKKCNSGNEIDEHKEPQFARLHKPIAGFRFLPLISDKIHLFAKLDILFLSPVSGTSSIKTYFDVDNRLKTLLDALSIPPSKEKIPSGCEPEKDENPFFCVLSDDKLVTELNVRTEKWLAKVEKGKENVFKVIMK